MVRKILALAVVVMLAACAEEPVSVTPLTLDYTKYGKINLAVSKLEFLNRAKLTPGRDDAYFQNYKPQLADSIYRWGVDRLQASGKDGRALLVIRDLTIDRDLMPHNTGIESWFSRETGEKWKAHAIVEIHVRDAANFNGMASATIDRTVSLAQQPSEAEKQGAYRRMVLGVMDDLNAQVPQAVREHLNPVVLTMP